MGEDNLITWADLNEWRAYCEVRIEQLADSGPIDNPHECVPGAMLSLIDEVSMMRRVIALADEAGVCPSDALEAARDMADGCADVD